MVVICIYLTLLSQVQCRPWVYRVECFNQWASLNGRNVAFLLINNSKLLLRYLLLIDLMFVLAGKSGFWLFQLSTKPSQNIVALTDIILLFLTTLWVDWVIQKHHVFPLRVRRFRMASLHGCGPGGPWDCWPGP